MKIKRKDKSSKQDPKAEKPNPDDTVPVAPPSYKPDTRWRGREPKFAPKAEKPANLINVGGMEVDPERQKEYENWLADKKAEQQERRDQIERNIKAKRARSARETPPAPPTE